MRYGRRSVLYAVSVGECANEDGGCERRNVCAQNRSHAKIAFEVCCDFKLSGRVAPSKVKPREAK